MLEHPAEPTDQCLAAIWKLPVMRMLLSFPEFQKMRVLQGLFGAKSAKPTDLLLLRLPHAVHIFHSWRTTVNPPKGGTIGKDGHEFKTSSLKEYPPALCGAIAETFLDALTCTPVQSAVEMPRDFLATATRLNCTDFGSVIGQDFAR